MEKIIEHIKVVKWVLKKEFSWVLDKGFCDDLFQQGLLGLVEASKMYDGTKGVSFFTFSTPWVRWRIKEGIKKYYKVLEVEISEEILKYKSVDGGGVDHKEKRRIKEEAEYLLSSLEGEVSDRDIQILKKRFGIGGKGFKLYREIAKEFGFSIGRGRQIVCRLLQFLKKNIVVSRQTKK